MQFHRRHQKLTAPRSFVEDLVHSNDLVLGFLDLNHLSELGWLTRIALATALRMGLEDARQLLGILRIAAEDASNRLPNHLPNSGDGLAQLLCQLLYLASAVSNLLDHALGLIGNLARRAQQPPIRRFLALFPLWP